ncbi:MAG: ribonuclease P protein component [Planctomycetota bacterium]|nr:ribonuclease P protein component [Planctomycetota bacterium]
MNQSETTSSGNTSTKSSETFPAKLRIKKRDEFQTAFKEGKVAADGVLVVHAVRADAGPTRMGISIAKRVGNAPQRNNWKRLIREAFRRQRGQLPHSLHIIIRPKKGATADAAAIRKSLKTLLQRLDRNL